MNIMAATQQRNPAAQALPLNPAAVSVPSSAIQNTAKLLAEAANPESGAKPGVSQKAYESAVKLLNASPNPIDTLKRILTSDPFAELNLNASPELKEAFDAFMKAIDMNRSQMLDQLLFQNANETKFNGELFIKLRELLAKMPDSELKTAVSQLLRAFDCYITSQQDQEACTALLNQLMQSLAQLGKSDLAQWMQQNLFPENANVENLPDTVKAFLQLIEQQLLVALSPQQQPAVPEEEANRFPAGNTPQLFPDSSFDSQIEEELQHILMEYKPKTPQEALLVKILLQSSSQRERTHAGPADSIENPSRLPASQNSTQAENGRFPEPAALVSQQLALPKEMPRQIQDAFSKFADALEKHLFSPKEGPEKGPDLQKQLSDLFSLTMREENKTPLADTIEQLILQKTKAFLQENPAAQEKPAPPPEKGVESETTTQKQSEGRTTPFSQTPQQNPEEPGPLFQKLAQRVLAHKSAYQMEFIKHDALPKLLQCGEPALQEPLSRLKQLLVRTQDGAPEALLRQAEKLFQSVKQSAGLPQEHIASLRLSLLETLHEAERKMNQPSDALARFLQSGIRNSASEAGKNSFQELLWNLILKNSANLPVKHFFFPINYEGIIMVAELWKSKKKEIIITEEEEKKTPERLKEIYKLFLAFDINKVGYFESSIYYSENSFSIELAIPESLQGRHQEIRDAIRSIIERNHMTVNNMVLCKAEKRKKLPEIVQSLA